MSKEHTTEHLRAELKSLSDTLEEVLSSSGEKSKEELSKIRSKAEQALKQSRYRLVKPRCHCQTNLCRGSACR